MWTICCITMCGISAQANKPKKTAISAKKPVQKTSKHTASVSRKSLPKTVPKKQAVKKAELKMIELKGNVEFAQIQKRNLKPQPPKIASLNGFRDHSQEKQNHEIDREGLSRFKTNKDVAQAARTGLLVPLPRIKNLKTDPRLDPPRRFCRPYTKTFLLDTAELSRKNSPKLVWQINAAVRSEAFQKQLRGSNNNAALKSSHTTGATIDISKVGKDMFELEWMRKRLLKLEKLGLIEAVEEWYQPVFHIMVFQTYTAFKPKT